MKGDFYFDRINRIDRIVLLCFFSQRRKGAEESSDGFQPLLVLLYNGWKPSLL